MSSLSLRFAFAALALPLLASPAFSQDAAAAPAPAVASPAPAPTPAPTAVEPQDTAEAKLAVVLRSYSLLTAENDQLRAAQEKLVAEKAALSAELAAAKSSTDSLRSDLTTASASGAQADGLRERLRQTQDQLGALALENNELKTKLALSQPGPGSVLAAPTHPAAEAAPAAAAPTAPAAAPAPRTHVIAAGDTLSKISRQYYGTPDRWSDILAANRDMLRDEKSLIIGRTLRIP